MRELKISVSGKFFVTSQLSITTSKAEFGIASKI